MILRDVQHAYLTAAGELLFDETSFETAPSVDVLAQALKDLRANRDRTEPLMYHQATLVETTEHDDIRREARKKATAAKARAAAVEAARQQPDAERSEDDPAVAAGEAAKQAAASAAEDERAPRPVCTCPAPEGYRWMLIVSPFLHISVGIVEDAECISSRCPLRRSETGTSSGRAPLRPSGRLRSPRRNKRPGTWTRWNRPRCSRQAARYR